MDGSVRISDRRSAARPARRVVLVRLGQALLAAVAGALASPVPASGAAAGQCGSAAGKRPASVDDGAGSGSWVEIYKRDGWAIAMRLDDRNVAPRMAVALDGVPKGSAALVAISHRTDDGAGFPQVAVIAASGYVRLKQNADPLPSIPFGSSFVLGPAYWPSSPNPCPYHHNPDLAHLRIATGELPHGPLRLLTSGTNGGFDVAYEMTLPAPSDLLTRLHVVQAYTARTDIAIDPARSAQHEGFRLVQFSSMFVNEGGTCLDGSRVHPDCHDSNAARYVGADGVQYPTDFRTLSLPAFIFNAPKPLGSDWLDLLHKDDAGWQGNTPNLRILLDALPADRTVTPQGYLTLTSDPNDDNVGLWLSDDGLASQAWSAGQSDRISYWLEARDDPPP